MQYYSLTETSTSTHSNEPKVTKTIRALISALTFVAVIPTTVIFVLSVLSDTTDYSNQRKLRMRRRLSTSQPTLPANIDKNLADISQPHHDTNGTATTPLFFHVPKASGTTIKDLYSDCYHLVEANHIGAQLPHSQNDTLGVFEPWAGRRYVNVDMASRDDIARAKALRFAESHVADLVFTSSAFHPSVDLFDPSHQAAVFTVLRHPVERAVSKFFYLQDAYWETHYAPETKGWTIEQYVSSEHHDRDWVMRSLLDKMRGEIDDNDLEIAKLFLKKKVLVGLTTKMAESIERFDQYFGFEADEETKKCQDRLMSGGSNSHSHPKIEPGSPGWNAIAEFNKYDVQLYDYAVALFEEQSKLFEDAVGKVVE